MFQLGVLLNSMKAVLDELRSSIENRFKAWNSYFPDKENRVLGERLSEVTVVLRSTFRSYMQALVEKLAENVGYSFLILFLRFLSGVSQILEKNIFIYLM